MSLSEASALRALGTVLRSRSAWPTSEAALRELAALGFTEPPALVPGETVIVTVGSRRAAGLWRLEPCPPQRGIHRALTGEVAQAAQLARQLVERTLHVTVRLPHHGPAASAWRASLLAHDDLAQVERTLEGRSFGLALALAHASWALDLPMPPRFVALAELTPEGALAPVAGWAQKASILERRLLGATTLLVARDQDVTDYVPQRCAVERVGTVAAALELVFPDAGERAHARWSADPARARRDLHVLYRHTVKALPGVTSWTSIRGAARTLERVLSDEPDLATRARVTAAIAARHEGGADLTPLPELSELPRPLRLSLLAHRVQSLADAHGVDDEALESARACLAPPLDRHAEDLMLLGAVARAQAHRDPCAGLAAAREAALGWLAILEDRSASRSLCEWIRLAGLLTDRASLDEALTDPLARVLDADDLDHASAAYLHLAAGRALVQHARLDEARAHLAPSAVEWGRVDPYLARARARWLARLAAAAGEPAEAERVRAELASRHPADLSRHLADLDRALEDRLDPQLPLDAIERITPGIVAQLRAHRPPARAFPSWIAEAFPY